MIIGRPMAELFFPTPMPPTGRLVSLPAIEALLQANREFGGRGG